MTLSYSGVKLKSEINPNTTAMVFPVVNRTARNNRKRSIEQVEIITVHETKVKVNRSNFKDFHYYFTGKII